MVLDVDRRMERSTEMRAVGVVAAALYFASRLSCLTAPMMEPDIRIELIKAALERHETVGHNSPAHGLEITLDAEARIVITRYGLPTGG